MTVPAVFYGSYSDIAGQVAQRLAQSCEGAGPLAPWAEEVVTASSGMAHAITAALLERIPSGLAALQLQPLETLARRIVNAAGEYPRVASDLERRLAMRTAARSIDDPLTASRGAGAMLERSYRDMRDSGITLPELSQRARRARKLRNSDRIRLLIRVWTTYERLIEKLEAIDAADLLGRAAALAASPAVAPQILSGFYDMTGAQLAFVEALRHAGKLSAVYIPVEALDAYGFAWPFVSRFDESALQSSAKRRERAPLSASPQKRDWTIRQEATRESELRSVCASIRALLDSGLSPQTIGVVVRALDPYDAYLLDRFGREHGLGTTASVSTSLAAHSFGRALVLLLRLRDRNFPRAEVLEIARSGLRLRTAMNADRADSETRQAQIAGGPSAKLAERHLQSPVIGNYIDTVAELEQLTAKIDLRSIQEVIDRFRPSTDSDLAALETLQQIVDTFRRAEAWKRPFDPNAFIDALEAAMIHGRGSTSREPAIWAGDVMTFRGRSFDHLFAIRMQDDVLPQRRVEDPLLVDADRRLLGIREIGDGRSEEQLLFRLMRGRVTHFSFASSDGFGKPLRTSQLLKNFAVEQMPEERSNILKNRIARSSEFRVPRSEYALARDSELGTRDAKAQAAKNSETQKPRNPETQKPRLRSLQLLARAGTAGPFDGYVRSKAILERAAAALQTASPTKLEDFGECPQKFFLKHILGVRDLENPEMELQINPREKGSVVHSILEEFYRHTSPEEIREAARALPLLPQTLVNRLDAAVEQAFDELDARLPAFNPPMRGIERRATRRDLRHFVVEDIADLEERALMPSMFEYRFGNSRRHNPAPPDHEQPFVLGVGGIQLTVEGMIDRVDTGDAAAGKRYRIVDYKSGKAVRHKNLSAKIDRGVRLQLALYAMAVSDFFAAPPEAVSGAIKPLAGGVKASDYEFELVEKSARLRETLEIFVAAILRGDFPAFPNEGDSNNDFNSCKYCPVNHSCRTRYDVDESRAALDAGEPRSLLAEDRG